VLSVRTAPASIERPALDLTARARIRDSAIQSFAADGFDASFRTIAARAGVSPALITHHYGSKAALRAECDADVLRQYRALKADGVARPSAHLLEALTAPGTSATVLVYILRAILAGGSPARAFIDRLIDDTRPIMAEGVASGLVRPSRDEEARLRYLTYQTMGALVVQFVTMPGATPEEFMASLRTAPQDSILPVLELFTEGLLTERRMLEDYLQHVGRSPARPSTAPTAALRATASTSADRNRLATHRDRP
jgi:AcrR family transcriptional regulator